MEHVRKMQMEGRKMRIENVMVPTDFSEPSRRALNHGVALARLLRAKLTLVHVLEPQRKEETLRQLGTFLPPEHEDDLDIQVVLKAGNARKEIVAAAQEQHADLVILGTHGRGRMGRLLVGSTTEGLLRRLNVPMMTVSHVASPRSFKRILFATDLSDSTSAGFTFALNIAQTLNAEILAIHALGVPMLAGEFGSSVQTEELAFDEVRRRLQMLVTEGKRRQIRVQTIVAHGPAAKRILKAADENEADLIVLAIEKKGIIERALLGTTAEQVVREAAVPVLLIPVDIEAYPEEEVAVYSALSPPVCFGPRSA
jgi:nucleotide-binding universal stress UspA family protein